MRKILKGLASVGIIAGVLVAHVPAHAASYDQRLDRACRFQFADGDKGWSTKEVERTITCFTRRWPVELAKTKAIAWRESNYQQYAYNPSGCSGVYQWAQGTWSSVLPSFPRLYGVLGHDVFNARSNVAYAVKYQHNRGYGPWGG